MENKSPPGSSLLTVTKSKHSLLNQNKMTKTEKKQRVQKLLIALDKSTTPDDIKGTLSNIVKEVSACPTSASPVVVNLIIKLAVEPLAENYTANLGKEMLQHNRLQCKRSMDGLMDIIDISDLPDA